MPEWYILTSYNGISTTEKEASEGTELIRMHDSVYQVSLWRSVFAEFIGLTLLVALGGGSGVPWADPNSPSVIQIALATGLMIATLIYCLSAVSGAHVNPVVTIYFMLFRKVSFLRCCLYVMFQCAGACLGAEILRVVTPDEIYEQTNGTFGCTVLAPGVSVSQGFLLEFVITFQLLMTIAAAVDDGRLDLKGSNALAVGLSVVCGVIFGLPYTGGSMNPARSFGTAVLERYWDNQWMYWLAPILGGVTGASVYEFCFKVQKPHHPNVV